MTDPCPPLSVLVVDDHPDTAGSTATLLSLTGHTARAALSGEEALRLAEADPPDVVLLDVHMPGLDGLEVARRLARTPGKPPLTVVVTGYDEPADRDGAAAAGVHLRLIKPVDPAVLVGLLRRVQKTLAPLPRNPAPAANPQ